MEIINGTEQTFNELIEGKEVLIDFYATWCGPCKMLSPELEEIKDKIQIIKINTDENMNLSKKYGVMSIPTLIHIKEDGTTGKKIGYMTKEEILEWIGK